MLTCSFRIKGLPVIIPRLYPIIERPSPKSCFSFLLGAVQVFVFCHPLSHPSCLAKRLYDSIVGALRCLGTPQHCLSIAFSHCHLDWTRAHLRKSASS